MTSRLHIPAEFNYDPYEWTIHNYRCLECGATGPQNKDGYTLFAMASGRIFGICAVCKLSFVEGNQGCGIRELSQEEMIVITIMDS